MTTTPLTLAGVDYGAKMAGTTAIAFLDLSTGQVQLHQSVKGKSADDWLLEAFAQRPAAIIAFDAPLSLPAYYSQTSIPGKKDYFYRASDRVLGAMSPLFLGGLTARAIRIRDLLEEQGMTVYETYPAKVAEALGLPALAYKKKTEHIPSVLAAMRVQFPEQITWAAADLTNWHRVDALLALRTAWRIYAEQFEFVGDREEGGIYL